MLNRYCLQPRRTRTDAANLNGGLQPASMPLLIYKEPSDVMAYPQPTSPILMPVSSFSFMPGSSARRSTRKCRGHTPSELHKQDGF